MSFITKDQRSKLNTSIAFLIEKAVREIMDKGGELKFKEVEIFLSDEAVKAEFEATFKEKNKEKID